MDCKQTHGTISISPLDQILKVVHINYHNKTKKKRLLHAKSTSKMTSIIQILAKNNCTTFVHRQVLYLAQHLVVYSTYFYHLACERFIVQLPVIAKPQQTIHFFWSSSNFAHNCNNTLTCHKFAIAKTREKLTIEIKRKQEKNQNYKSFQCKKEREKN